LVDELGGLSRALELAKELAGIPIDEEVRLIVQPKKVSFFDAFFGRRLVKINIDLDPGLERMFSAFMFLNKEKILAIMPFWFGPE
jgi:protease-4